ncbi:MAG: cell wall hydrolase [Gemmobacter sp.]|jgi:spore germination cell wall hydrolase CwlJ-like protein|nr:cell wall hydrolase [Gemmobacter sp.]
MALAAVVVLSGAAFADVTVSQSNDPAAAFGGQMASLLGMEKTALGRVAPERLAALADSVEGGNAPSRERKTVEAAPSVPKLMRYDNAFLAGIPVASGNAQWECLAQAVYHEARGESVRGQFAVAEVVLNRVDSPAYPPNVCAVVHQGGSGGCQFSYICDGKSDATTDREAWLRAGKIARLMLDGAPRALTQGATHFHTVGVRPPWASRFARTTAIGAHLFYRQ